MPPAPGPMCTVEPTASPCANTAFITPDTLASSKCSGTSAKCTRASKLSSRRRAMAKCFTAKPSSRA